MAVAYGERRTPCDEPLVCRPTRHMLITRGYQRRKRYTQSLAVQEGRLCEVPIDVFCHDRMVPLQWIGYYDTVCWKRLPLCSATTTVYPCRRKYALFETPQEWQTYRKLISRRTRGPASPHTQRWKFLEVLARANHDFRHLPSASERKQRVKLRPGFNQTITIPAREEK
jgi:hypothetical protein